MYATATTIVATAPAFNSVSFFNPQFHRHLPFSLASPTTKLFFSFNPQLHRHISLSFASSTISISHYTLYRAPCRHNGIGLLGCPHASISRQGQDTSDPELRSVLQLATVSELFELERILFGPSYFSPLLKSIAKPADIDYVMIEEDPEEWEDFIAILESRFFFLAADARSTLRGWRPSYRNVLLGVRKKLNIPCSTKLSTEDLEVEIFLHLLQDYSRGLSIPMDVVCTREMLNEELGNFPSSREKSKTSDSQGSLEHGLDQWKVQAGVPLRVGAVDLRSMILKGGGMFTLGKLYKLIARGLSGRMFLEAANYKIKNEFIRKAGHLAATNLESRAALLAAKQGVAGAASRYLGLRSMMALFGPVLWGTFLADVVIQMLGTDYARILRAIYAFAQIRLARTYRVPSDIN